MKYEVNFKCISDDFERIPDSIIEKGINFPKAHTNKNHIVSLATELKKYRNDAICRVPFCTTVEAEALGANIKLGDEKTGPRVNNYAFNSIEELENINEINLNEGRVKEVLDAVEVLNHKGEIVCLNVEGPFTIISSLMEPRVFYRAMRKNKDTVDKILNKIEDSVVKYAVEGIRRGAKIISYGDPVGAMDIVGPKVYNEFSGKISYNILKKLEEHLDNTIVHLCGKTSTAFEHLDFVTSKNIEYDENLTYGEALLQVLKERKDIKYIGHSCIKRTPLKTKDAFLWGIVLNRQ